MRGITTMLVFSSDQSEILHSLQMCTSTALEKAEAKKIFREAPYQLGNPEDLFETMEEESQTPITVITSSFKGKIQILITRKSENLVELFLHEYGTALNFQKTQFTI